MMARRTPLVIALAAVGGLWGYAQSPREKPVPPPASATDILLVKRLIAARHDYQLGLEQLRTFYESVGDTMRMRSVEDELRAFHRVPKPAYIIDLDVAGPGLRPDQNVPAANEVYRKAMSYFNKGIGSEFTDNQIRAELLFQQILQQYPTSNAASDAAYHLGEIYESARPPQYRRAAVYFERCFQWNPATPLDARTRAARIYDRQLNERNKAIEIYKAVLASESDDRRRKEADRRIGDLGGE